MSCYKPLKAFKLPELTKNGKSSYKICSHNIDHIEYRGNEWIKCETPLVASRGFKTIKDFIEIPCGSCIGCRLDYSRMWANRCVIEMKEHDHNYFLTLTYDDEHLPKGEKVEKINLSGEVVYEEFPTLIKEDLQKFFKRLRKNTGQKFRYYACGEYGDKSGRSHFHAILFGLQIDDLVPVTKSNAGYSYFSSNTINKCWPYGYAVVGEATWETCAYTARYVMKKHKGKDKEFYEKYKINPEFVLMSRKPGIARQYYDQNKEKIFDYDFINIGDNSGVRSFKPPRYYKSLYEIDDPDEYQKYKDKNKEYQKDLKRFKLSNSSKSYIDILEDERLNKEKSIKTLIKKGV